MPFCLTGAVFWRLTKLRRSTSSVAPIPSLPSYGSVNWVKYPNWLPLNSLRVRRRCKPLNRRRRLAMPASQAARTGPQSRPAAQWPFADPSTRSRDVLLPRTSRTGQNGEQRLPRRWGPSSPLQPDCLVAASACRRANRPIVGWLNSSGISECRSVYRGSAIWRQELALHQFEPKIVQ